MPHLLILPKARLSSRENEIMRSIYALRHKQGRKIPRDEIESALGCSVKKTWVSFVNKVYENRQAPLKVTRGDGEVLTGSIHTLITAGGDYAPSIKSIYDLINE